MRQTLLNTKYIIIFIRGNIKTKKIISLIIITAFISNGLIILGQSQDNSGFLFKSSSISDPTPFFYDDGKYVKIEMNNSTIFYDEGKPMLPVITKIMTFPFGSKIIDVNIQYDTETHNLSYDIYPCPPLKIYENNDYMTSINSFYDEKT
ncbi:hypothetical protein ACFL1L_02500, partial [Thermoplasmatota archaeon]